MERKKIHIDIFYVCKRSRSKKFQDNDNDNMLKLNLYLMRNNSESRATGMKIKLWIRCDFMQRFTWSFNIHESKSLTFFGAAFFSPFLLYLCLLFWMKKVFKRFKMSNKSNKKVKTVAKEKVFKIQLKTSSTEQFIVFFCSLCWKFLVTAIKWLTLL